jgi:hypothetical protein
MTPSPSRTFPFQNIAARRRNEHARRVRFPEEIQESSSFPKYRLLL